MRGDELAGWSGWPAFFTGVGLVLFSIVGSLLAGMGLYGYRYNLVIAAMIFVSGLAPAHIFCAGRLGRGYDPFHPLVRGQWLWLLTLHMVILAVIASGGAFATQMSTRLSPTLTAEHEPKHDSIFSWMMISAVVGIYIAEVVIARNRLQKAVTQQQM